MWNTQTLCSSDTVIANGVFVNILKLAQMYTNTEQRGKWMVDGESRASHWWGKRLQINKEEG